MAIDYTKEIKKDTFDKSVIENTVNEFQEIRITGSGKLSEEIIKKSTEDFEKLEGIIKNKRRLIFQPSFLGK